MPNFKYFSHIFKTNFRLFLVLTLLLVIPILFSGYIIYILEANREIFSGDSLLIPLTFYLISIITISLALTPTTFIAILSGFYFSWYGLPAVVVSYMLAVSLGFVFGKLLNKYFIGKSLLQEEPVKKYLQTLGNKEVLLVVFARLSPVLPSAMMNVVFAGIDVKWKNFLIGSLIGMFPRTFLFFWAGKNARDVWAFLSQPSLEGALGLIPLILVLISTLGLIWLLKWGINKMKQK